MESEKSKANPADWSSVWKASGRTIQGRLFRASWRFVVIATATAAGLKLFWSEKEVGDALGPIGIPLSVLYGACFVYSLTYLAFTYVIKSRFVRIAWLFLLGMLVWMGSCSVIDYLGW